MREDASGPGLGRLAFIDNVRASMIVLVIGMHAAVTYSPFGRWYVREHPTLDFPRILFFLTFQAFLQGFFMALLFFVAGCFAPGAYDRKGFTGFLRDRCMRLGVPALLYVFLIGPLTEYYLAGSLAARNSFGQAMEAYVASGRFLSGTGPLWFCVALLIFSAAYALWRASGAGRGQPHDLTASGVAAAMCAMAAATFLVKTAIPSGTAVFNMQLADFPSYIAMFAAGIAAGRGDWLRRVPSGFAVRMALCYGGAAVLMWWPLLVLGGAFSGNGAAYGTGWRWQNAAASLWANLVCIGFSFGVLVAFRRFAASGSRFARFMSANAFAVYVIHPPILVAVTLALRSLALGPLGNFLLAWGLAAGLSFGLAAPLVRRWPPLRAILR
nr:acyltransferase [uncultured Rhodopila sp.]